MQRQKVKNLFRNMLRACRGIDDLPLRNEIRTQVKTEFRMSTNVLDTMSRNSLLIDGNRRLKLLLSMQSTTNSQIRNKNGRNTNDSEEPSKVGEGWPWERS